MDTPSVASERRAASTSEGTWASRAPTDGRRLRRIRGRDQIVVLRHVPWESYEGLCKARKDGGGHRIAYLDGTLEIMSPAPKHEWEKKMIGRLVETYAEETGLSLNGFGSTTFKNKGQEAGIEPDECYCLGPRRSVPDLAIDVINTHGDVDKLEIYRRLKVAEVWVWEKARFSIYRLSGRSYVKQTRSLALPKLELEELTQIVMSTDESHQTEAVRTYRKALRRR